MQQTAIHLKSPRRKEGGKVTKRMGRTRTKKSEEIWKQNTLIYGRRNLNNMLEKITNEKEGK